MRKTISSSSRQASVDPAINPSFLPHSRRRGRRTARGDGSPPPVVSSGSATSVLDTRFPRTPATPAGSATHPYLRLPDDRYGGGDLVQLRRLRGRPLREPLPHDRTDAGPADAGAA